MNNECLICGDDDKYKFMHKLCCGHIYHYECIEKTFMCDNDISCGKLKNKNYCPYCSCEAGILPIINGINKTIKNIHYSSTEDKPIIVEILCKGVIGSGKNKGDVCNRKCIMGFNYCKLHKKNIIM